jgi:hypothetical protein
MLATVAQFVKLRTKRVAAIMDLRSLQHWANGMILTTVAFYVIG